MTEIEDVAAPAQGVDRRGRREEIVRGRRPEHGQCDEGDPAKRAHEGS